MSHVCISLGTLVVVGSQIFRRNYIQFKITKQTYRQRRIYSDVFIRPYEDSGHDQIKVCCISLLAHPYHSFDGHKASTGMMTPCLYFNTQQHEQCRVFSGLYNFVHFCADLSRCCSST